MSQAADVHTLTGAYAAGALDEFERTSFERHLADCPDCRDEVRGLRETLVRLAEGSAVTPPQGMRLRVLDQVRTTPQARRVGPAQLVRASRPRAPWLVAAVFALLAVGSGSFAVHQHQLAQQADQRAVALAAVGAVVGDPGARRVSGTAVGGGTVTVVFAGPRAAVLTSAMPGLPAGRAYQLWVVRAQRMSSAGLGPGASSAAGSWSRLVDGVRSGDVLAITVEPSGGSRQPTTTPVVALRV